MSGATHAFYATVVQPLLEWVLTGPTPPEKTDTEGE